MRRNGFAEGPVCALLCNSPPSDLLTNFSCFSQCRKHASFCQFLYVRGKRKKKEKEMYVTCFLQYIILLLLLLFFSSEFNGLFHYVCYREKIYESNKSAMEIMLKRRHYRLSHIYTHSLTGSLRQPWKFFFFLFCWPFPCDVIYNAKT